MPEDLMKDTDEDKEEEEDEKKVSKKTRKGRVKLDKGSEAKIKKRDNISLERRWKLHWRNERSKNRSITFFFEIFLFCDGTVPGTLLV